MLEARTLLEDGTIHVQKLTLGHLTLIGQKHQLPSVLELAPQTLQGFSDLVVAGPRLAGLACFSPPETDIWIGVITLLMSLELQRRMQGLVAHVLSPGFPVLIDGFGMLQKCWISKLVEGRQHHVVCDDSVVHCREGGLLRSGIFKNLHDSLKVVLGQRTGRRRFGIVLFEEVIVLHGHVILATDGFLDRLREAQIGRGFPIVARVEIIVIDLTFLWRRNRNFLIITSPGILQDALQMVFLDEGT
jgi:hypothetical protein